MCACVNSLIPPSDPKLRSIIDKLAQFVAKNGYEFESLTKSRNQGNPEFEFLFGGAFHSYYLSKISEFTLILKSNNSLYEDLDPSLISSNWHPSQSSHSVSDPFYPWSGNSGNNCVNYSTYTPQVSSINHKEALNHELSQVRHQLLELNSELSSFLTFSTEQQIESENNMKAHEVAIKNERNLSVGEILHLQRLKVLKDYCASLGSIHVTVDQMEKVFSNLIESCTKDNISRGKVWVLERVAETSRSADAVGQFILCRVAEPTASFNLRLHMIYLINDLVHHTKRKSCVPLQTSIESIVVPVFSLAVDQLKSDISKKEQFQCQYDKLMKVLQLWRTNELFPETILERLGAFCEDSELTTKRLSLSLSNWFTEEETKHIELVQPIIMNCEEKFSAIQKQHNDFVAHLESEKCSRQARVTSLEQNVEFLEKSLSELPPPPPPPPPPLPIAILPASSPPLGPTPAKAHIPDLTKPPPGFNPSLPPPVMFEEQSSPALPLPTYAPNTYGYGHIYEQYQPAYQTELTEHSQQQSPYVQNSLIQNTPENVQNTKNENSQTATMVSDDASKPSVPFWDLPAALMIPLIPLSRFDYKTLDPKRLRLPPPPLKKQEEHIRTALEAFYSPPNHERPRDSEGWERLGLYEFTKAKEEQSRRWKSRLRQKSQIRSSSCESRAVTNTDEEEELSEYQDDLKICSSDDEENCRFRVTPAVWSRWEEEQERLKHLPVQQNFGNNLATSNLQALLPPIPNERRYIRFQGQSSHPFLLRGPIVDAPSLLRSPLPNNSNSNSLLSRPPMTSSSRFGHGFGPRPLLQNSVSANSYSRESSRSRSSSSRSRSRSRSRSGSKSVSRSRSNSRSRSVSRSRSSRTYSRSRSRTRSNSRSVSPPISHRKVSVYHHQESSTSRLDDFQPYTTHHSISNQRNSATTNKQLQMNSDFSYSSRNSNSSLSSHRNTSANMQSYQSSRFEYNSPSFRTDSSRFRSCDEEDFYPHRVSEEDYYFPQNDSNIVANKTMQIMERMRWMAMESSNIRSVNEPTTSQMVNQSNPAHFTSSRGSIFHHRGSSLPGRGSSSGRGPRSMHQNPNSVSRYNSRR